MTTHLERLEAAMQRDAWVRIERGRAILGRVRWYLQAAWAMAPGDYELRLGDRVVRFGAPDETIADLADAGGRLRLRLHLLDSGEGPPALAVEGLDASFRLLGWDAHRRAWEQLETRRDLLAFLRRARQGS